MKRKIKYINLLLPLIVAFAILFPVVHSYEHIKSHVSESKTIYQDSGKSEFKLGHDSHKDCAVCHFKFSPVTTFSFVYFEFNKSKTISASVIFYVKTYTNFFTGSLFSLRGPPQLN